MTDDLLRSLGGPAGCRALAESFYGRVQRDPVLRPLFPGKSLRCAIEEFSAFLVQFLGGPPEDAQFRWSVSVRNSHLRFRIGARERDAWLKLMRQALDEAPIDSPARDALRGFFEQSSAYIVNSGPTPTAPEAGHPEVRRRWAAQVALDQAVAAIHAGDVDAAIGLAGQCGSRGSELLAAMIAEGDPALMDYVHTQLRADPALGHRPYRHGRTLLHEGAAAGRLATVRLLLELGVEPDARDGGGHTPLYCLANECGAAAGADVVYALVDAGADVNAPCGSKRCTPLHMAARRGSVAIAQALLERGADPAARDTQGVTPLRRALNCRKTAVAAILRDRA